MIILKPLQTQSINDWKSNNKRSVIVLPTGSGKTIIALDIVKNSQYNNILVLVNTNHLITHWKTHIEKYNLNKKIEVKTIQSVYKQTNLNYDLLIGDEAHRLVSPEYSNFLFKNNFKDILFLTCDITRYDGRETLLKNLNIEIINKVTHQQAINEKLLSDFKIINYGTILSEGEQIKYSQYQKFILANFKKFKYNFNMVKTMLYDPIAQELIRKFNLRKQLLSTSVSKFYILLKILKEERYNKCIIFTENIDYAESVKDFLLFNKIDSGIYHSKTNDSAIIDFRSNKINILITVKALDEGFDIPSADMGIIMASTQQHRQTVQRLGRLLRYQEGKEAKLFNIYIKKTKEESWLNTRLKGLKNIIWR